MNVQITNRAQQVLDGCRVDGSRLFLPPGQLERDVYLEVDRVLKALGGKWNSKAKAHLFDADPSEDITNALAVGRVIDKKKALEFFETPIPVAEDLAGVLSVDPGMTVLEPSAGRGRLVKAIQRVATPVEFTVVDINPAHCAELALCEPGVLVPWCGDFLALPADSRFDRVGMNPPFSNGKDVAHVRHAYDFLKPGGRLVSVMSPSWTFREVAWARTFREWAEGLDAEWTPLPEGSFRESGTGVNAGLFVVDKPSL